MLQNEADKIALKALYKKLVVEFSEREAEVFQKTNFNKHSAYITGKMSFSGVLRKNQGHQIGTGVMFDKSYLYQKLHGCISLLESSKPLYDFIVKRDLWPLPYGSYVEETRKMPSLTFGLIAGFIARNFEITGNFHITDESFRQSAEELMTFLNKDFVETSVYVQLRGFQGEMDIIELSQNVFIKKCDYEIARRFSIHYTTSPQSHDIDMFEGDYILLIRLKIPKKEYDVLKPVNAYNVIKTETIRWQTAVIIGCPGFVEIGKVLYQSPDWPIAYSDAVGPYGKHSLYPNSKNFAAFSADSISNFIRAGEVIRTVEFNRLDETILHSLERLTKSKEARNINDRVVELSIALEYLINTTNNDVTLQLVLKTIKLVFEANQDETIYKKLKKFYDLRSKIIHGNSKLEENQLNGHIIDFAEDMTRKAILRYIELNKRFTYKQIDEALLTSLHVAKTVEQLLGEGLEKTNAAR